MSDTTRRIPMLAKAFLTATQRPMLQRRWRHSRESCRSLLRCCRNPSYLSSSAAAEDLRWLLHLYALATNNLGAPAESTTGAAPGADRAAVR